MAKKRIKQKRKESKQKVQIPQKEMPEESGVQPEFCARLKRRNGWKSDDFG